MSEVQNLINQIPIRHNWISMFILCGWVQGFLLSSVIFFRSGKENQSVKIFGWFLFFLSAILLDVYLCYSGLMKYTLHFNDSTEVFVLLLGPMIFFFVKSILTKEKINFRSHWKHFVLPILYFLSQVGYFLSPIEMKLNAYLPAHFPELGFVTYDNGWHGYGEIVKDYWRWILLSSFFAYTILITRFVTQYQSKFSSSFWEAQSNKYGFSKNSMILFTIGGIIIFIVYLNHENDGGDHFIATFISFCIFVIHISILNQSRFFEKSWVADKYDTSGLQSNHQEIFQQVQSFFEKEKYYLKSEASLGDLATQMNLPANYISQSINNESQQNFNDFINQYRIEEVKNRLGNSEYAHLNIAGIGKTVGFKSKSAFYAAFKKYTNLTPTQFLKSIKS